MRMLNFQSIANPNHTETTDRSADMGVLDESCRLKMWATEIARRLMPKRWADEIARRLMPKRGADEIARRLMPKRGVDEIARRVMPKIGISASPATATGSAIWHNMCVLEEIARRLKCPEDFVAFSRISRSCRAAAVKENITFTYQPIPWLMLPPKKGTAHHRFYSILDGTCQEIYLPDAVNNRHLSSKGVLLVVDKACNLFLLHPFTNARIDLPHPTTFQSYNHQRDIIRTMPNFSQVVMIIEFAISGNPFSSDDYTVVVIYTGLPKLAYFRPGFTSWIDINTGRTMCEDVIYFQDKFYTLQCNGRIVAIDIKTDNKVELQQVVPPGLLKATHGKLYLVESDGNLFVIHREVRAGITYGFQIYQVDLEDSCVFEIIDLGSIVIFVGDNSSLAVDISSLPVGFFELKEILPFKSNRIYFSDDSFLFGDGEHNVLLQTTGQDLGFYDLKDGRVKRFEMPDNDVFGAISFPFWVEHIN